LLTTSSADNVRKAGGASPPNDGGACNVGGGSKSKSGTSGMSDIVLKFSFLFGRSTSIDQARFSNLIMSDTNNSINTDLPSSLFRQPKEKKRRKPIVRFGQRKLLLGEVAFLNKYGHLASLVIYVGAAPGKHVLYL
jgi:hypothetical protein